MNRRCRNLPLAEASARVLRPAALASRLCLILALAAGVALPMAARAGIDPDLLAGMEARSLGPAGMSGRVASIDASVSNPNLVYVGAATGGVWKSMNGGLTWKPVFDDQPVAAIGTVSIFQPSPDIVWVGTGEGNPRNSVSVGNGIYRTLDGGETWTHLGLEKTERIHRIVLHPTDPDIAYVAAMGRAWGENRERGVFKTTDGGRTWKKILYVDAKTGAADLVMDPTNPSKLFAALWDYRRWPWFFRSGGPGSGLYSTVDGGESWTLATPEDGLPEGDLGRIGLAIAPSDPSIIYALVEAKDNALYVSKDGGRKWQKAGNHRRMGSRPFYYGDIRVDPQHADRIYSLWSMVSVSDDGGKSFSLLVPFRAVHPDHHAMWIDPLKGDHIYLGNDGGVAISNDRGQTWRFVSNLPLAQYYHVHVDMDTPYNVYGGMQDNGSWRGPSQVWENGGIRNHHWEEVGFGDGFDTLPHPDDSMTGYAMSQEGYLVRWDLRTGERRDIRPPAPDGVKLRFNWNAGLAIDPFDADTLYFGSQFVHRSTNRGRTWEIISDDLTTDNPEWQKQDESGGLTPDVTGAENFTSILTIAPSPVQEGVIWVGTDDGRLHLSRDGGETWTGLEDRLKGVPDHTWIPQIEASPHDGGTAFVTFDDHRRSNWTPYIYRTDDFGRTWKNLATKDVNGYCLAMRQDPVNPELLFLGTEFGLHVSNDGGTSWMKWTHGVPTVSVMDLVVHPREHDLVLGTHGRAAFVLDDIRPLRTLSETTLAEPLHLFDIADAQQYRVKQTGASRFPGHGEFRGENRPYGALLTYSLNVEGLPHPDEDKEKERQAKERQEKAKKKDTATEDKQDSEAEAKKPGRGGGGPGGPRGRDGMDEGPKVKIEISDESGELIRTFKGPARLGVNRASWNLRRDSFKEPPREGPRWFEPRGPQVLPGTYSVTVKYEDHEATTEVRVLADPRFSISISDRRRKWDALVEAGRLQETVTEAVKRIVRTRGDINTILAKAKQDTDDNSTDDDGDEEGESPHKDLMKACKDLTKELTDMEKRFWRPPGTKGIVVDRDVLARISYASRNLGSSWGSPTEAQMTYLRQAEEMLQELLEDFNQLFDDQVADFRRQVSDAGITLLPENEPLAIEAP